MRNRQRSAQHRQLHAVIQKIRRLLLPAVSVRVLRADRCRDVATWRRFLPGPTSLVVT